MAESVVVERRGFTQVVTINRPEVKNAMDGAAARALAAAPVFDSQDAREGAAAFAEKRAPVWRGM